MVDPRARTGLGGRRFVSLRRRIYELLPDVPEEAVPLVLAIIEQAAIGADLTQIVALLASRDPG